MRLRVPAMAPPHAIDSESTASLSSSFYSPVTSRIRNRLESMSATVFSFSPLTSLSSGGGSPMMSKPKPQRRLSSDSDTSLTSTSTSSLSSAAEADLSSPFSSPQRDKNANTEEFRDEEETIFLTEVSLANAAPEAAAAVITTSSPSSILLSLDKSALQLCFGAAGVYACYLVYGHIQEDVFRYRSPSDGSSFQSVWFLQVLECACNICFGFLGRRFCGGRTPKSYRPFFVSGASQVLAKVLTSASLAAGLSFPVCILAKSAKMVPVMAGQLLLGGSKYTTKDYVFAGLVVLGTTILSMNKGGGSTQTLTTPLGLAFILLSLVADGVTGGLQKRLKKEMEAHPPTTFDFVLFTNMAMGMVALTIALLIGDITKGLLFLYENPLLQQMVWSVCLLSAMGQFFVFYIVAHFDPMVCATVTTTRKILSVVWSIATKGHVVSVHGYVGLAVAIFGMGVGLHDNVTKKKKTMAPRIAGIKKEDRRASGKDVSMC